MSFKTEKESLKYLLFQMEGLENIDGIKELQEQVKELLEQIKGARRLSKADQIEFKTRAEKKVAEYCREFTEIYDTLPESELY